jgi:hypothetical protein
MARKRGGMSKGRVAQMTKGAAVWMGAKGGKAGRGGKGGGGRGG